MRNFFYHFSENIFRCFRGRNLLWHLLAISITYILVTSGFDWLYFESTRSVLLREILFPAVRLGWRMPVLAPIALYIAGSLSKKTEAAKAAFALGQSVLLGLLIAAFYKALTGRVHPPRSLALSTIDISHEFKFGFLRGGVFWGWPSSHTTIAFAMAITLVTLYPKNRVVKYLSIIYAFYIGIGVSATIHWFSDFIAGAIIGTVIGMVVGKCFREDFTNVKADHAISTE